MTVAVITDTIRCNSCPRLIPLSEVRALGLGNGVDGVCCVYCRAEQINAMNAMADGLEVFASERPIEEVRCRACQLTFEEMRALNGGMPPRFYGHMKDGEMALVCKTCSDVFAAKATELYRGTKFESNAKLRGAK